jgi:DNA-binding SARP family transcriptional activator
VLLLRIDAFLVCKQPGSEVKACVIIDEMERVDVMLLGGFEVTADGEPVPAAAWTHGRARDLVKLLALAPDHRLSRDRVLEELWPQLGVEAAMANLHKAAHHGRRALGEADGVVLRGGLTVEDPNLQDILDGPGRDRTCDLGIKSPLLYRLSYRPAMSPV